MLAEMLRRLHGQYVLLILTERECSDILDDGNSNDDDDDDDGEDINKNEPTKPPNKRTTNQQTNKPSTICPVVGWRDSWKSRGLVGLLVCWFVGWLAGASCAKYLHDILRLPYCL
uniref:Uncharacterized protein n=1 Tax=Glossina brevipalpis TaxID=37001 RepID=A0A1A9WCU6_9MUSC